MDLSDLERQLDELERRHQDWSKPLDQFTAEALSKVNVVDGYSFADFQRELEEMRQKLLSVFDPYKNITDLLNQLCPAYLTASSQQQEQIRNAVRGKAGIQAALVSRIRESADRLRSSGNQEALLDGLAAASIENGRTDFRDVLMALAELYVAAEEIQIDPKPHFQAVALLSSDALLPPDNTSTRKRLADFHTFAILRERKGEITPEEKQAMEEMVKKAFQEQFKQAEQATPWWKRIFGGR